VICSSAWLQWILFLRDSDAVLRDEAFEGIPWLRHGFGTRLSTEWPGPEPLASAKQIHSDRVLRVESPGPQGEGDALISNLPGIDLTIRTADCLPILIADRRNRAVAAVHAGWRGVVAEIVPKTIDGMRQQFGSNPEDLLVVIGPGIGACCFEVGPEVAVQFQLSGRTKIDLAETVRQQLGRNGVTMGQISASGRCTYCESQLFESYRRDRDRAGRMTALIGLVDRE
jgi:polyphenol oxidase